MRSLPLFKIKKILLLTICLFYYAFSVSAQEAEQKFQGFNLQGYKENGEKDWDVNGDTADIHGSEVQLTNVNANSYGDEKVNVTAKSGTIDQASGNMHLEKDVVIISQSGTQMETDSLDWHKADDLVTTKDDVMITDTEKGMTVTGTGMTAKPGLKEAKIEQDVTLHVKPEPGNAQSKTVTITCDGPMEIDQSKSQATFNDNVFAVQEGRILKADRMEIYFDADNKKMKEIICIGNVEVIQGENKTYAQRAVYNAQTQKMTLSGKPKLILLTEGNNVFTTSGN